MLECSSELIGGYTNMALDESEEEHNHIVRVLLDTAIDSPVDLLLCADNCTSIERLRQLIKKPGLWRLSLRFGPTKEQYEDLLALESYINWTNNAGHFDITTRTRANFDTFIGATFGVNNPIAYAKCTSAPVYMYGHEVPRNHAEAMELDKKNGNTQWADSESLETSRLKEYYDLKKYDVFDDCGHKSTDQVYAVKHDGCYMSRLIAGGHRDSDPPL